MIGGNNNLQHIFPNVDSILLLLVFLFVELIATYSKSCAVSEKHPSLDKRGEMHSKESRISHNEL